MRTEVKIGLIACVVVTGAVVAYLSWGGSESDTDAPDGTKAEVSKLPAKPTAPKPAVNIARRPQPKPARRTIGRKPLPSASANRTQRVGTRSIPQIKLPAAPTAQKKPLPARPAVAGVKPSGQRNPLLKPKLPVLPALPAVRTVRTYVVKAGDTGGFYGIAKRSEVYGDSRYGYLIAKANPTVDSRRLRIGQKLKIPPLPVKTVSVTAASSAGRTTRLPSGDRQYVIAKGDTLSALAERYYGGAKHVNLLVKANPGVNPDSLKIGQTIVIPKMLSSSLLSPRTGSTLRGPAPAPGQKVYTIKDGDQLVTIARREYGSSTFWPAIAKANPGLDPNRLSIGRKILLPGRAEAQKLLGRSLPMTAGSVSVGSSSTPAPTGDSTGYVEGKPYFD